MNLILSFLQKTIGQKIVVGLTGLGLCLFVLIHMLGNLLILSGPEAYNNYAYKLHELPGLLFLELGLFIFFIGHILLSILLQIKNKQAQGSDSYQKQAKGLKKTSWIHQFLWIQGMLLLIFLIFHLWSFKFGPHYETELNGKTVRDIYQLVVESFKKPLYTFGYSFILFILSVHLFRGFPACFKTLGLSHPVYISWIEKLSWFFSAFISFGFLAPIWYIYFFL